MPAMSNKEPSNLSIADQEKAAMERIVRTVNICETSTSKMREKLRAKGFDSDAVEAALKQATSCSLIDDMRYANCLVRSAISSGRGLAKVEQELKLLGIDINEVETFVEFSESGEMSQIEMAIEILRKRPPKAKNKYAAAYRKLICKGYSSEIAAEATRSWCEGLPHAERPFMG